MLKKQLLLIFFGLLLLQAGMAQTAKDELILLPVPAEVTINDGKFRLTKNFKVATEGKAHPRLYAGASRFLRRLDRRTGLFFEQEFVAPGAIPAAQLVIKTTRPGMAKLGMEESYHLNISGNKVVLTAETDIGALRGLETLLQLLSTDKDGFYFPAVDITDTPRFPWRGLMIDVARHFQPIQVIKRNIDGMAAVKMNVLHLHLTDDQGIRIESKIYPQLTALASEGEFFTQTEMKEIIRYADERGIRVIPEFDVPGHATSWLVAFPELASAPGPYAVEEHAGIFNPTLNPAKEETYVMLGNFFKEMVALFPDEYFHIGGDENEGKHWDENDAIQTFMAQNNIADNHELQAYFNQKVLNMLNSYGKIMVGWDEILHPDLPQNAVIQSWRGPEGIKEAASKGYNVILSNGYYIDLMYPASQHYLNDPLPADHLLSSEEQKNVLGGEATMWSELVTPATIDSRIWPRTAAIAERLWSPVDVRNVADMYRRLSAISLLLEEHGLQHITSRDVILRNISNGRELPALRTLANLVEPMKGYTRNPGGTMYAMYSPLSLFADAAIADAPLAMEFNRLIQGYLENPDAQNEKKIKAHLIKWEQNHEQIMQALPGAPLLRPVAEISKNLSAIASLGLAAMNKKKKTNEWLNNARKQLESAREPGARTELQIVDAIEKLVMKQTASLE